MSVALMGPGGGSGSGDALTLVYSKSNATGSPNTYTTTKAGPVTVILDLPKTNCNPTLTLDGTTVAGTALNSYYRIQHNADWHEDWTGYSTSYSFYAKAGQVISVAWTTGQPSIRIFAKA